MMPAAADLLIVEGLEKSFTLHLHGGARLPVVAGVAFAVERGECVVLGGPSGAGKSSILKMAYGNYRADRGRILLADGGRFLDIAQASPGEIVDARRRIMGYVSQFLRVIPRVSALDIVAAAARGSKPRRRERGRRRCSPASTCPTASGPCRPRPFRAASSSGSTSPAASRASTIS
jgi:alpha-D-ribose 1-methylphosphonate 5-triphosphate synthase subunit PhnL